MRHRFGFGVGFVAACVAALGGCAKLPVATPGLVGDCAERIENASVVDRQTMQTLIMNADISAGDMEDVAAALRAVDPNGMSPAQADAVNGAIARLAASAADLKPSDRVRARPESMASITNETVAALRVVQGIIGEKVDQESLVNHWAQRVKAGLKGNDQ